MDSKTLEYWRHPGTAVIVHQSVVILVRPDGSARFLGEHVEAICQLLTLLRNPHSKSKIKKELGLPARQLEELLASLVEQQSIISVKSGAALQPLPSEQMISFSGPRLKRIVFGISGAIQAATIINLVAMLKGYFADEVDVVLTDAARRFLQPEVLSYYALPVWTDVFQTRGVVNVPHFHLANTADLVAVIPASASTIHRLASGACTDLLSLIVAATQAPVVVAPSMNATMWRYPAIERNIQQLRDDGMFVIEPGPAIEVGEIGSRHLKFCGIGVSESNVASALGAVANLMNAVSGDERTL